MRKEGEEEEVVARVSFREKEGSLFDLFELLTRLTNDSYIHRSRLDLIL